MAGVKFPAGIDHGGGDSALYQRVGGLWVPRTVAQVKTALSLTKADVGLGSVDNTADTAKPVSTATQTALDGKQALDADLTSVAGLSHTTGAVLQSTGSGYQQRALADLRTDLTVPTSLDDLADVNFTAPFGADGGDILQAFSAGPGVTHWRAASADSLKTSMNLNLVQNIKCNFVATTDPAATDDGPDGGYSVGSIWVNGTADRAFICVDATDNAAIWRRIDREVNDFPTHATLWHDETTVVSGNGVTLTYDDNQQYSAYTYQNTGASGDIFEQTFFLAAGTYGLYALGLTNTSYGQVDWLLDGAVIAGNQDWYSASLTYNVLKSVAGVTVATSGLHTLRGRVDSKNASSSGYNLPLTKMWFRV